MEDRIVSQTTTDLSPTHICEIVPELKEIPDCQGDICEFERIAALDDLLTELLTFCKGSSKEHNCVSAMLSTHVDTINDILNGRLPYCADFVRECKSLVSTPSAEKNTQKLCEFLAEFARVTRVEFALRDELYEKEIDEKQ